MLCMRVITPHLPNFTLFSVLIGYPFLETYSLSDTMYFFIFYHFIQTGFARIHESLQILSPA
jgi:hypothetical protein